MYPYRVFISYSHEDRPIAKKVAGHLEGLGFRVVWDKDLQPGTPFTSQIETGITSAHVFMPLLTKSSAKRPWVHQEIGYAMGLSVPVLPVTIGELPEGIIKQIQAVNLQNDLADLEHDLTAKEVEQVVLHGEGQARAVFQCAELPEDRKLMLVQNLKSLLDFGCCGRVRQIGGLTSFSLPDKPISHAIWAEREGQCRRGDYYHKLQWEQRIALERHARECGCDLIINPNVPFEKNGPQARKARLRTLLEFLESMPDDKARVAIRTGEETNNLLIVGDWFVAESFTPRAGMGYLHSVCTWHAPTVLTHMAQFDAEFEGVLNEQVIDGVSSRQAAIELIHKTLDSITV
jgi:hypothetical protein